MQVIWAARAAADFLIIVSDDLSRCVSTAVPDAFVDKWTLSTKDWPA